MNNPVAGGREIDGRHLERLSRYLERDPGNIALLLDAAHAAFEVSQHRRATEWLQSADALSPLGPFELNMLGVAALATDQLDVAEQTFARLLTLFPSDATVVHDYSYTLLLQRRYEEAFECLNRLDAPLPENCATLRIRLLHFLGRLDDAIRSAEAALDESANAAEIGASLASLYLDVGRLNDAQEMAIRYSSEPESATTLGIIQLLKAQPDKAKQSFEQALATNGQSGRALLGAGLATFSALQFEPACTLLDRAALTLKTHPGTWLAAGWCYLLAGNFEAAEARLEEARRLDRNFAETHGSLAVLRWVTGNRHAATKLSAIATSLDPNSFSAKLVQSFVAESTQGQAAGAEIRANALRQPVLPDGAAIAPLLTAYFPAISLDTLQAANSKH